MLRGFVSRFLSPLRRRRLDRELEDEIRAHLGMAAEENLKRGMTLDEARLAARRSFGGVEQTKEKHREQRGFPILESVVQDARFGLRSLRKSPGFTLVAVVTVALGIGATTAVFSVVDRILFRSLPYPNDDRLVSFGMTHPTVSQLEFVMSGAYFEWKETQTPFEAITSWGNVTECDLAEETPVRLTCGRVEWDFLPTLGVQPLLGRNFRPDEDRGNSPKVALLSYGLWQQRFGGDRDAAGSTMSLDGRPVRIVGVLPRDFELPTLHRFDLLVPQALPESARQPSATRALRIFARLKPDVTLARAEAELRPQFEEFLKAIPPMFRKEISLRVRSLRDRQAGDARRAAWLLFAAVAAVLLVACANVANLLLARAASRQRELAVRAALGAGRGRLVRQSLTESMMLGALGGLAGCGLAYLLLHLFTAIAPSGMPRLHQAALDARVLLFTLGASLCSATLLGLTPALQSPRPAALAGSRTTGAPRGFLRYLLVVTQVAASLILLTVAGLLLRSLWNLQSVPLGMDTDRVVSAQIVLGPQRYAKPAQAQAFFEELEARARRLPGVETIALSDSMPPRGQMRARPYYNIEVPGRPALEEGTGGVVGWRAVTPGYFAALSIPIVRGRSFIEDDRYGKETVLIVSETLAGRLFPNTNPLMQRVRLYGNPEEPWLRVVGVAGDVRNNGLAAETAPEYYLVRKHAPDLGLRNWMPDSARRRASLIIRSSLGVEAIGPWLRREVAEMDPALPVEIETLDRRVGQLAQRPRFNAMLLSLFAAIGVTLAAIGLYGVMSFLVTRRTREIGVRVALGATRKEIAKLVLSGAAAWTLAGALLGVAGSFAATRWLKTLLFQVPERDPATFGAALAVLFVVALMAAWIPSRRATRVDPMTALRDE